MRVACRAAGDAIRVDLSVRPPALRRRPSRGPRATEDAWEDAGGRRCCASWRRRAGRGRRRTHGRTLVEVLCELVRAWRRGACLMDPATHGRCSTAPQRTGSTSGRQAQAALFSLVRYVNSYVRARTVRSFPPSGRCGGFERERARAATPNRVGRRAPHTRGGCRACAQPNTVGA